MFKTQALQAQVVESVKSLFRDIRNMRNYIVLSDDLKKNHPKLFEMIQKLYYESWMVCENTKRVDRRLRTLQQNVSKRNCKGCLSIAYHCNEKHCPQRGW